MPHRVIISLPTSHQYFLPMQPWINLATWLVCKPISSQLSNVKPFLGRCLLKYSPESCHWYLQKIFQWCSSILSNSAHRQKAHCSTEPKLLCHWRALKGCPLSLSPTKTFAVMSTGVYLHPGCRECWWEQDHEPAPCEIPVSTLHWQTGFLHIITFWDLSISWFLSLLIGVCNGLCTEMLGFFQQNIFHYQMKCLAASSLAMLLLLSVKLHLKEKTISSSTEILLCTHLPIHTKKQSICKTSANKKIYSVI